MATIKSTDLITSASILAQQFAKRPVAWAADTQRSSSVSAGPAAAQQNKPAPQSALTAYLNKWADAKQAIEKLNQIPQDIKQSRKAAAVEMIQRIKEQIRILMMLGAGDPKATAQQVAQLARQLAAAAHEYAAASGGDTQANAASSANDLSAQNAAVSSSAEQSTAASVAPTTTDAVASTTPDASAASAAVAASSITAASPAEAQSPSQHVGEQIRSKVAEYAQNASESNSDQEFIKEVKKLVAQLKALAKQNQVHSPKHPEKSTDLEMESINEALKEVERSLASIDSANSTVTVSIDVIAK